MIDILIIALQTVLGFYLHTFLLLEIFLLRLIFTILTKTFTDFFACC